MIKLEKVEIFGWESAIRGMRNPMNSWDKSDSEYPVVETDCNGDDWFSPYYKVGANDLKLMKNLVKAGNDHAKFMRMINVTMDITAPLYWWKEFDTYKVGTVANSCSTMHKIHAKGFTLDDFSHEHLKEFVFCGEDEDDMDIDCVMYNHEYPNSSQEILEFVIEALNTYRVAYLETKDKTYWWQMIQLLPSSYNQKRTVQLNYAVLRNMYHSRKNHKLDEWVEFCKWIETLPYSELITGEKE